MTAKSTHRDPSSHTTAEDTDGSLAWVRFYINGDPYGDVIPAFQGVGKSYPYGLDWEVPARNRHFYAVAMEIVVLGSCLELPRLLLLRRRRFT